MYNYYRWFILAGLIILLLIVLDEIAYHFWKVGNPGSMYTNAYQQTAPLVDPLKPPQTFNFRP